MVKPKGFMKFFIQSDEDETEVVQEQKPSAERSVARTLDRSGVNQELFDDLLSSSINGPYTQFFDMVKSLSEYVKEESACFKAAFASISKISPTSPEKLMLRVDDCMNTLKSKRDEFMQSVEDKKAEIGKISADIEEKTKRIAELKSQIDDISSDIQSLETKVESGNKKVEKAVSEFDNTYKSVEATLEQNKQKIGTYIKGA